MKTVKRIAAVLLAVMLMAPAAVNAAAPSVRDTNLNKKKATATVTYNKKTQLPTTITVNGQKLVVGKDCVIVKKKKSGKKFNLKTKAISKKVTYKVTGKKSAKKYIKVSKKGKVTIKKGIKKGTYKIVIKAKATKNHKQGKKVVKITIK